MKHFIKTLLLLLLQIIPAASWPNEFNETTDLQPGFSLGIAPEIEGLWLGDEKYKLEDNTTIEPYCSRAIFSPEGYLTWESVWNSTCRDAEVVPRYKATPKDWLRKLQLPGYIYRFRQKTCLTELTDCDEDVTRDYDRSDGEKFNSRRWNLEAKACGAHLKDDQINEDTYTCESYQVSLLSRIKPRRNGETLYVLVITLYYHYYYGGWEGYTCKKPSFKSENINAAYDGATRFVLQGSYNMTEALDPCQWDCFDPSIEQNNPGGYNCST